MRRGGRAGRAPRQEAPGQGAPGSGWARVAPRLARARSGTDSGVSGSGRAPSLARAGGTRAGGRGPGPCAPAPCRPRPGRGAGGTRGLLLRCQESWSLPVTAAPRAALAGWAVPAALPWPVTGLSLGNVLKCLVPIVPILLRLSSSFFNRWLQWL